MILHTVPRALYNAATLARSMGQTPRVLTQPPTEEGPIPSLAVWAYRVFRGHYDNRNEARIVDDTGYALPSLPGMWYPKRSLYVDQEAWDAWWAALNADVIYPQDGPEL